MIHCPNYKSKEWIDLASELGEDKAIRAYELNDRDIPSVDYARELLDKGVITFKQDVSPVEHIDNVTHKIASERLDKVEEYLKRLDSDNIVADTDSLRVGGYVINIDNVGRTHEELEDAISMEKERLENERDILKKQVGDLSHVRISTPEYKDAYANHNLTDLNGKEIGVTNEPKDANHYSPSHTYDTALKLKKVFDEATGLDMSVIYNHSLEGSGQIAYSNDIPVITFNPNNLRLDSIYHEFGHVLVDTIGYNDPLIKLGIEQVLKTDLATIIKLKHPELNQEQFEKEVLTTAIGTKASEFIKDPESLKKWNFWVNRMYRALSNVLNKITNGKFGDSTDVAKTLATRLVNGNIGHKLMYKPVSYIQHQIDEPNVITKLIDKGIETINKSNQDTEDAINRFRNKLNFVKASEKRIELNNIKTLLVTRSLNHVTEALARSLSSDLGFSESLIKRFDELGSRMIDGNGNIKLIDLPPTERRELLDNILNGARFMDNFANIANIRSITDSEISTLERQLANTTNPEDSKKLMQYIADMKNYSDVLEDSRARLNANGKTLTRQLGDLYPRVIEYNVRYSTNPKEAAILADAMNGVFGEDVGSVTYLMDSLIKSPNSYAANLGVVMHTALINADREKIELKKEVTLLDKLAKANGFKSSDISERGSFVRKYDFDKFNKDVKEAMGDLKSTDPEFFNTYINFMKTNTSPAINDETGKPYTQNELYNLIEGKRKTLSREDFNEWKEDNFATGKDGIEHPKIYSQYLAMDNYINKKWQTIQSNPKLKDYYDRVMKLMAYTTDGQSNAQSNGLLPGVRNRESTKEQKKIPMEHNDYVRTGPDGREVRVIPYKFVGSLDADPLIKIPEEYDDETHEDYLKRALTKVNALGNPQGKVFSSLDEVYDENARIREANKDKHAAAVETNLTRSLNQWIDSSMDHKYLKNIESEIVLGLRILETGKLHKTNVWTGNLKLNKQTDPEGNRNPVEFRAEDSNIAKQVRATMDALIYNKTIEPNKFNSMLRGTKNYISLLGMGFNVFANAKNITRGSAILACESLSHTLFTTAELHSGFAEYLKDMTSYLSDANVFGRKGYTDAASTKSNAFIKQYTIIKHYNDLMEMSEDDGINKAYIGHLFTSVAFLGQELGSHMLQNAAYGAMRNSHRLVNIDGKWRFMTIFDLTHREVKQTSKTNSATENKAIMTENEVTRKTIEERFKQSPTINDIFDFKDNYLEIKDEYKKEMGEQDIKDAMTQFQLRVVAANHEIHGVYDKANRGVIEQSLIGQMAVQFRKWMRPGWNARFGYKGGVLNIVPTWDEASQLENVGSYKAFGKFVFVNPISDASKDMFNSGDPMTIARGVMNVMGDYAKFVTNAKVYWHMMTPVEQAGVKRASAEFATMGILFAGMLMARRYSNSSEERKKNAWLNFAIYTLDATRTELMSFLPVVGWIENGKKIMASPTATTGAMTTIGKLTSDICAYPFQTAKERVFNGGSNRGDTKIVDDIITGTPIANIYKRIVHLTQGDNTPYALWGGTSIGSEITNPTKNKSTNN